MRGSPGRNAPSMQPATLLVLAKSPRAGLVKTRLMPHYTAAQAADLAAAALADTLAAVAATPARRRVLVLDGPPPAGLPRAWQVVAQRGAGLDQRLAHAFALVHGPALLVGMDTPQVTPALLDVRWDGVDAWFGPALDGGFWALGFAEPPSPSLLVGVPMSRPDTGALTLARLGAAGLTVAMLPVLRDVDTAGDVAAVADVAPDTHFAAAARALAVPA